MAPRADDAHEHADAPHPFGRLGARGERPSDRACQRDELAPSHGLSHKPPAERSLTGRRLLRLSAE
jgi:hypothetical protein